MSNANEGEKDKNVHGEYWNLCEQVKALEADNAEKKRAIVKLQWKWDVCRHELSDIHEALDIHPDVTGECAVDAIADLKKENEALRKLTSIPLIRVESDKDREISELTLAYESEKEFCMRVISERDELKRKVEELEKQITAFHEICNEDDQDIVLLKAEIKRLKERVAEWQKVANENSEDCCRFEKRAKELEALNEKHKADILAVLRRAEEAEDMKQFYEAEWEHAKDRLANSWEKRTVDDLVVFLNKYINSAQGTTWVSNRDLATALVKFLEEK